MWIIIACQHISRKVTVKGVKKCCVSNAVDENDDSLLCNDNEENGNVCGVSMRKMKALTVKWRQRH